MSSSPVFFDAVDWGDKLDKLTEKEKSLTEKERTSIREKDVLRKLTKRGASEENEGEGRQERMVQMERDVLVLKRKVRAWDQEEQEQVRNEERIRVENEKSRMENEVRERVWFEEREPECERN